MIAFGIAGFGYEPFGWRVGVAVAGTLSVGVVYLLAWRLLRGFVAAARGATVGAIAASGLLATDFLHLVHSRVGMLDAFIVLFATAAVLFIVLDRDRVRDRTDAPWWWRASLGRPWRLLAGVALGAAAGTKWSGAYVAPAVIGLVIAWEIAEQRRREPGAGWRAAIVGAVRREAVPDVRAAGDRPAHRLRRGLHRAHAGRAAGAAVGPGFRVARHLGAPAGDARLPHDARRRSSVPVAAVVVAAAAAPGGLLVRRGGRLVPRDPGPRESGAVVAGTGRAGRAGVHVVEGGLGTASARAGHPGGRASRPSCRG